MYHNLNRIYHHHRYHNLSHTCDINCRVVGSDGKEYLINIDYNNDRKAHFNLDTNGDGIPDVNLVDKDVNGDGKCDFNCDIDGDGRPDINIDLDNTNTCDLNCDTDGDNKCDYIPTPLVSQLSLHLSPLLLE